VSANQKELCKRTLQRTRIISWREFSGRIFR